MDNEEPPKEFNDVDLEADDGPDASQLPSVEDVRMSQSLAPNPHETKRRRKKCVIWTSVLIAVVCLAVIIGVAVGRKNKSGGTAAQQTTNPQTPPTAPPPVRSPTAPSSAPGPTRPTPAAPVSEMTDAQRERAARTFLADTFVSSPEDLADSGSPQHKALKWISKEDTLRVAIPENPTDIGTTKARKFVQRYALAVFYYATQGETWFYPFSFLSGKDECEWYEVHSEGQEVYFWGAHCEGGTDQDMVSQIWLPNNDMGGTIPKELEQFTNLKVFALEYNLNITGQLPDSFHSMNDLNVIVLSNNMIEGKIPASMKRLANLEFLALDDNNMEGNLNHIKDLETLKYVYLEDNFFQETIDEGTFSKWPLLEQLDLSDNNFDGPIPSMLLNHDALRVLDLHDNDLTGPIPEIPSKQGHPLEFLALHKNGLTGPIPTTIKHLQSLTDLDLSQNGLTGTIVSEIGKLTLNYLFLGKNSFTKSDFPSFIHKMTNLTEVSLKKTNLHGTIPTELGQLTDLYLLDLDQNKLEGGIPTELGGLDNLIVLMLNRNKLSGTVPTELADLPSLGVLLVDGNDGITGDLNFMCARTGGNGTFFALAADCGGLAPTIGCSDACCTLCCGDPDEKCDDMGWTANYDPIWELSYERYRFEFDMERRL